MKFTNRENKRFESFTLKELQALQDAARRYMSKANKYADDAKSDILYRLFVEMGDIVCDYMFDQDTEEEKEAREIFLENFNNRFSPINEELK